METTHVFIVDTKTFKSHLEYLFAGTGAKDHRVDFNGRANTVLKYATENSLVGMISDSQRIRRGDGVVFYLQQDAANGVYEGKFYGIFEAQEDLSFLDNNDARQFLSAELNKSLTFRTLLSPRQVYPKGVTEWEALDEIKHIQSPNQMLWSLIYRKLKGNRGNTMITIYESERLFKLIRDKNNRQTIPGSDFTFNLSTQEIEPSQTAHRYTGRTEPIDVLPRLLKKYAEKKAFEAHLQAYLVQNIGRNKNASLDHSLLQRLPIEWVGNEVSCGVGMQRIDVMLSLLNDKQRIVTPVELKAVEASLTNTIQIQRYVDWLEQYYIPNRVSDIQPALIAKRYQDKASADFREMLAGFGEFNKKNQPCMPLRYIEYEVINNVLHFTPIDY
jgi:predicted RNA-binding protein